MDSKRRLKKYQQLRAFQERKRDMVKQQVAAQRHQITVLNLQKTELKGRMADVEKQFYTSGPQVLLNQHGGLAMARIQTEIRAKETEIEAGEQSLKEILQEYHDQDKQLKSWERLIDQETQKIVATESLLEMKRADERYLSNRFAGDQS